MTATELQGIVRKLANSCWSRYWLHWNYPNNPTTMAIQCLDTSISRDGFVPVEINGLSGEFGRGFKREDDFVYVIPRTNEDGTPFESKL